MKQVNGDKIVAVIPTLGKDLQRLNLCINSIKLYSKQYNLTIIVVNNNDKQKYLKIPQVDEVISLGINLGWVGALEYVRKNYEFDFLWTIQDDLTLENDNLKFFLEDFNHNPNLAVTSPVILKNGFIPANTRGGYFIDKKNFEWAHYPPVDLKPSELDKDCDLLYVTLSGALIRKDAIEDVDGFNLDLYPLLFVDVDFCYKLISELWEIKFTGKSIINHLGQGSTPSFLGKVLYRVNNEIFKQNIAENKQISENNKDLDNDFIFKIAKKSSRLIFELAEEARIDIQNIQSQNSYLQGENSYLLEQNSKLNTQLQNTFNSNSWKLTKPLRKFREKFKI
jgi:GT2 family glycosyltransferase